MQKIYISNRLLTTPIISHRCDIVNIKVVARFVERSLMKVVINFYIILFISLRSFEINIH